jgi:hypothetical protein
MMTATGVAHAARGRGGPYPSDPRAAHRPAGNGWFRWNNRYGFMRVIIAYAPEHLAKFGATRLVALTRVRGD